MGLVKYFIQDFHLGILNPSSIHFTGSFTTAILHSRRQGAVWQPGVRFQDGVNRHLDPFPKRFLGRLAIPLIASPRFSPAGCGLYPVGKGSDSICPTMAPKSRRVRWLSARSSQYYRV
jgi:hypothetical protein